MKKKAIIPPEMPSLFDDWRMSPAVEVDGFAFLTGFNGMPLTGNLSDDPYEQIETAFDQVFQVLAEAGMDAGNIVEITSYHVGLRTHLSEFKTAWKARMQEPYPAWTAIEVVGFASEGVVVELRVVAKRD
jgi:enamine deaminase RidA (YjgF/YER057c/UK114 family)